MADATGPGEAAALQVGHHGGGDNRIGELDAAMKRHQFVPDSLIEVLHAAQRRFGCLEPDVLHYIARRLMLPASRVYGVATFYHFFSLVPKGKHTCVVCTGTACYVRGADRLLAAARECLAIDAGMTTADGQASLMTARCLGTCGLAPLVVYDGEVAGDQRPELVLERMKGWIHDGPG